MAEPDNRPIRGPRPVHFVGDSREALRAMPEDVRDEIGKALYQVQMSSQPRGAVPLKEFHGTSVMEIRDDYDTDTYRCIYTARFREAIYVLHPFQKRAIRTARRRCRT